MTTPRRVLVLEDSENDFLLIARELKRGFDSIELRRVDDPAALGMALQEHWDVVISDWSMPRLSALEALGMIGDMELDVPFLIVSGTIGEEAAVEAMRSGAKDYLLKDRLARLIPAVERELQEGHERREHRKAEEALRIAEGRYRLLFNQGPLPELLYDSASLRLLAVNDAAVKLYGYTREDLLGMSFGDLRGVEKTPEGGAVRHRRQDGTLVAVDCATREVSLEGHDCKLSVCRELPG